eukprot:g1139.t1
MESKFLQIRKRKTEDSEKRLFQNFTATFQPPVNTPDDVKLKLLIQHKKLKLLHFQREFKKEILTERFLSDGGLHNDDKLMEWSLFEHSLFRDKSYQQSVRSRESEFLTAEEDFQQVQRHRQNDRDIRRKVLRDVIMRSRLTKFRSIVMKDRKQKEDEDRVNQMVYENQMVCDDKLPLDDDDDAMLILNQLHQSMECVYKALDLRRAFLKSVMSGSREMRNAMTSQGKKLMHRHSAIRQWHAKELKSVSRLVAARVRALKDHDYSTYLELVRNSKDERLKELMQKTDDIMIQLSVKVQEQKRVSNTNLMDESMIQNPESHGDQQDPMKFMTGHLNYYELIHQSRDTVVVQPSLLRGGTVRHYQLDGLSFLVSLFNNGMNGILADEMGLGKTIQTIALLAHLTEHKRNYGPHLIVGPKAVLHNWSREFCQWAPDIKVVTYDGTPDERRQIRTERMITQNFNVLLTHYDLVIRDKNVFRKISWEYLIVDEGHRLKNSESKLFDILGDMTSRFRLLLTGTPIQNSLAELWSLLNFLLPKVFSSSETFDEWFAAPFKGAPEDVSEQLREEEHLLIINRLHQVIRPFMLRRTKIEVEQELPSKIERVIKCELSAWQKHLYSQISTKAKVHGQGRVRHLNNLSMHLRKACNHPYLFVDRYEYEPKNEDELYRASGKLELLNRILPKLKTTGHRVLLFSQMTHMLDLIEEFLELKGYQYVRLDGSTKTQERAQLLDAFNAPNSPYFLFMLSTRAGGLGLNLQSADTVIIFDSDWNPAMDLQAEDRAHRIGQLRDVLVLTLVCAGTIEEAIMERANEKRDIDAKVIQAGMFNDKSTYTERQQLLKDLLKKGFDASTSNITTEMEVNELIARSRDELLIFEEMDDEEEDAGYQTRLLAEDEVPDWVVEDQAKKEEETQQEQEEEEEEGGRSKRKRRFAVQRILTYEEESDDDSTTSSEPVVDTDQSIESIEEKTNSKRRTTRQSKRAKRKNARKSN